MSRPAGTDHAVILLMGHYNDFGGGATVRAVLPYQTSQQQQSSVGASTRSSAAQASSQANSAVLVELHRRLYAKDSVVGCVIVKAGLDESSATSAGSSGSAMDGDLLSGCRSLLSQRMDALSKEFHCAIQVGLIFDPLAAEIVHSGWYPSAASAGASVEPLSTRIVASLAASNVCAVLSGRLEGQGCSGEDLAGPMVAQKLAELPSNRPVELLDRPKQLDYLKQAVENISTVAY